MQQQTIMMNRSYFKTGVEELGKQGEEQILVEEMERDMVDRIIRRLDAQLK